MQDHTETRDAVSASGRTAPVPPNADRREHGNDRPADPWLVEGGAAGEDCHCCDPPEPAQPRPPCTRTKPPKGDCCEALLDLLTRGESPRGGYRQHKPKTSPKVKLANWCCDWPFRDSILPLLALLYERFRNGIAPQNEFELQIYSAFRQMTEGQHNAISEFVDRFRTWPDARNCAIESRWKDWPDDRPLDPDFVGKVIIKQFATMGRWGVLGYDKEEPAAGHTRPWELTTGMDFEGTKSKTLTAPWPWVCMVNPGADGVNWYKNKDFAFPDKRDLNKAVALHDFDQKCEVTVSDPQNPSVLKVTCTDNVPAPPGPGQGFAFQTCPGGFNFEYNDPKQGGKFRCLKIPACIAGQGVALSGFNFVSLNCRVELKRTDGPAPAIEPIQCTTLGDSAPASDGANCGVRDMLVFTIPRQVWNKATGVNDSVPPGRYELTVVVPNESNFAPEPGPAPASFRSNTVLLDVLPPIDVPYQVWFERARCYQETSGWGDDEPWFRHFTAAFRSKGAEDLVTTAGEIFTREDIESGDTINFAAVNPFSNTLTPQGCVAIAVLGLEVDDEDAAKQQIRDFWDAYQLFYQKLLVGAASGASGGLFGAGLDVLISKGVVTASLVAGGVAIVAIAAIGLAFADWAPADPIAYDVIVFDQVGMYRITMPNQGQRAPESKRLGNIDMTSHPKGATADTEFEATYREERQYWCDDEESRYGLDLKVNRLPV